MIKRIINNPIKTVMSERFDSSSQLSIGNAVKSYNGLLNVRWEKNKDKYGRMYVTLSGDVKSIELFFNDSNCYSCRSDININVKKILREISDYKEYMILYDESEQILNYIKSISSNKKLLNQLDFDYADSNVRIYIQFHITSKKNVIPVSSGYLLNLKVNSPDLGYLGCLFNDIAIGDKCLKDIYHSKPIRLNTSF